MRVLRRNVPGVVYHLIWRFVDQRYFIQGPRERSVYLGLLGQALANSDWLCLAYAVMSNHLHLAAIAGRESLASWTRRVNSPFATWMNDRTKRIGPVFARSASDYAIAPSQESRLLAYIHRNPVRAGLVHRAHQSTWTSHRAFLGKVSCPPWLHVDKALDRIGMTSVEFASWLETEEGDAGKVATDYASQQLRRRGALRVGTPATASIPVLMRPTGYWRPDPRTIVRLGCEITDMPLALVCSRRRIERALIARRAIAVAAAERGISYSEIGDALGISQQAVSWMAKRSPTEAERITTNQIRERLELERNL